MGAFCASTAPSASTGPVRVGQDGSQGGGPCVMSSWTAASSDCSRPVNNYVHVKTADLYRPNARLTPERQGYQVLTPFGKLGYSHLLAIYLTQVAPTYSVRPRGGLSAGSRGVRAAIRDRRGLSRVSGAAPVAGGVSVPALWGAEGVARATTVVAVRGLRPPDVGDRRHDLPGHADAVGDVVPSDVVGDEPEDGGERLGVAADVGSAQLQDRLDVAPQASSGDGASGPRLPHRLGRSGRDLCGGACTRAGAGGRRKPRRWL